LYRREVFEKVGNFYAAKKTRGTDTEFAMRVVRHFRCLFTPQAIVYHKPRGSFIKIFRWFIERGRSQVLIAPQLIERRKYILFCIKNSISLRLLLLALLLYLTGPLRWIILLALTLTYYMVNLVRYSFQLKYLRRYDVLFLTPFVKLTMDIAHEIGQLHELIKILTKKNREVPSYGILS
jgi:GT2 family glycosyltransferase